MSGGGFFTNLLIDIIVKIDKKEAQKLGNIMYRHRVKWALQ